MTVITKYEFNQEVWFIKDGKIKKDWINYIFVQKGVDDIPFHRYQLIYTSGLYREVDLFSTEQECKNRMLEHTATFGNEEEVNVAMNELKQLNPTYHCCPDWDNMVICDKDKEYDCCTCEK